jgi:hypothetical protein
VTYDPETMEVIREGQALIIRNLRDELDRLKDILVTCNIVCAECYLHGEKPGKHAGPCIEDEVLKLKSERLATKQGTNK